MKQRWFDLAILGGGCAGLSLARELSLNKQWHKKTVIIEPRTRYLHDRSWCFWEPQDSVLQKKLAPIIAHRWQQWRFSSPVFSQIHTSQGRHYCHIAADDFYQHALALIHANEYFELWQPQTVINTTKLQQGFQMSLADGSSLHAHQVIDTRPSVYQYSHEAQLWQIFYGQEIETRDDVFDDSTVGLMEDLTGKTIATQFLYVLPFSKKRALVELTQFSNELFTPEKLAPEFNQCLLTKVGKQPFNILRTEQACLPMGLRSIRNSISPNYHYAGTNAGAIRPATGYAFMRIQQWAQDCANRLAQGQCLLPVKQSSPLVKAMDHIFLRVLHDTPGLGVSLFQALAQRVQGESLTRFLMDEAKIADYYQIIKALPTLRFLLYTLGLNDVFYPKKSNA